VGLTTLALFLITSPAFAAGPQPNLTGDDPAGTPASIQSDRPNATCPPDGQCFADVPPDNVFYAFVNRIYQQDLVTGYPCGGPNEPCDPEGRPYYRPVNNVTRQQMAKFIDNARILPQIHMDVASGTAPIYSRNAAGNAIAAYSTSGQALIALSQSQSAIYAQTGTASGVYGLATGAGGIGLQGVGPTGVRGVGSAGPGVRGEGSTSSDGVYGTTGGSNLYAGVEGVSTGSNGKGVTGRADSGALAAGVYGSSASGFGVYGSGPNYGVGGFSTSGTGIYGQSSSATDYGVYGNNTANGGGVHGNSSGGTGVRGDSATGYGVFAHSTSGIGVAGSTNGSSQNDYGVYGVAFSPAQAGHFFGDVDVSGTLSKGAGSFKIDDPLDPANKYLYHSFVESPDMMNIYNGNVTTDANGDATVQLPDWFEPLNRDFRYQLTPIGQFAQVMVSSEIKDNHFTIKTDKPNVKVSWQVTGIRQDPYANAHRIPVEEDKLGDDRGKYLHPTEWSQPASMGIDYNRQQAKGLTAPNP
jgi:hypothetical protein